MGGPANVLLKELKGFFILINFIERLWIGVIRIDPSCVSFKISFLLFRTHSFCIAADLPVHTVHIKNIWSPDSPEGCARI